MKRLLVFILLFLSCWAQGQITPNSPKAKIRVESVTLCPGQTADVAVYVDFGEYATKDGVRAMENFMFFLYLTDTSVCEIVSSYKRRETGTYNGKVYDYWICEPVLKDMHPNIRCCMQNSYIYGRGWQSSGTDEKYPKGGRFATTWFANESQAFMLTDSIPVFRIRIRCKKEGVCGLEFCDAGQMAFSTGLSCFGGQYFDFRGGITNGQVGAMPGSGPDKRLVDAGRDSLLCVGSRLTLNGEGGSDYKWTEVSGKGNHLNQFLAGSKTKNPTFTPQEAGTYVFQMAAFAPNGCSTLDTVVYTVGANTISEQVLLPEWNFVDLGSSVMFRVAAKTQASGYPLTITFAPDTLFAEGMNVFKMTPSLDTVRAASLPIYEPNLVAATIRDKYGCKADLSSSVFIKGRNITGYLNPFPIYRCGNDNSDKSIQLNVLTKGGSGKFNYRWRVTDLEPGKVTPPSIDDPFAQSPRLYYQGLCAVSVSIYDLVTGENVLISDTMTYRDWLHPTVEVVVDTLASGLEPGLPIGPFCEGKKLTFKLQATHAGDKPTFQWRFNGLTQEDSTGLTFSAVLNRDDSIDVIMYSDEECAAERSVQSAPFGVNVRYPVYMNANVVNSSGLNEPYLNECYDSVKYRVLTWNTGTDYTITWRRNEKDVIYEGRVHVDSAMGTEEHSEIDVVLPRIGFYDNYSCAISQPSMPCAIFDFITTESAYLNQSFNKTNAPSTQQFHMSLPAELLPIQTDFAMQAACEGSPITITTDIRYLPRDFTMIWFKKPKDGGDSVFLGYYRFDLDDEDNTFEDGFVPDEFRGDDNVNQFFDLAYIMGYTGDGGTLPMTNIRNVVADGFKLRLNDDDLTTGSIIECNQLKKGGFDPGDALYYVLYTHGTECGTGVRRYRSENFVPNLIKYGDYSDLPLVLTKQGAPTNCPTAPMVVVASIPGLPDNIKPMVHYEWRYDGRIWIDSRRYYLNPSLESDLFPDFSVIGEQKDTLYVNYSPSNVKITCRAVLDFSCGLWGSNKFKNFDFNPYVTVGAPNFTLAHTEDDTIVCAGSEITLWAQANEKNKKTYKNKRKAAKAASEYEYAWSTSWATLPKQGSPKDASGSVVGMDAESASMTVTPNPAKVPTGKWDDWNGDGVSVYYLSVHHKSADCWAYDSVFVYSAPDEEWPVSLQFTKQGVWCDSMLEGPNAQRIFIKNESGSEISRAWYLNGKRQFYWTGDTICAAGYLTSDTIGVRVLTDLITCRPSEKMIKLGIPYHESPVDVLTFADPETAKVGDRVTLSAGSVYRGLWGTREDDYVLNVNYRWEKQESDGSWTAVPASEHGIEDAKYNTDTMSVIVPNYTPHYRVISQGFQQVCPADTGYVEIPVAVPTEVSLDVVEIKSNGEGGFPIYGMCQKSDDYVMITGVEGNTGTYKDSLFNITSANMVRVRAFPQNPGSESWVMYYLNGDTYAVGPVGASRRLPEMMSGSYRILENGEYCDMPLKEFDKVYVMYGTDTISADGRYTHYSSRYEMWRVEPNGALQLESEDYMVCPGGGVSLKAYFDEPEEDNYGHIDQNQKLVWEPAEALDGTPEGWTATGKPTQETVYKVSAEDGMHCPWTDSLRIYLVQDGAGLSLPFSLSSPDSVFCGNEVRTGVRAYIPDNNKDLSNTFSEITYYLHDASGAVKETLKPSEGIDTTAFTVAVQDGWTLYAVAKAKASCNTALSYSDTLTFRAVARPVIERILPVSADTTLCMSQILELKYAQPMDCGFTWYSELVPKWGGNGDLHRAYTVDRNTEVVFEAYRNDLPSCRNFDTVHVNVVSGGASGMPSLALTASAKAVCGEQEVVYTLQERNCDTIIWYVNGVEAARDVTTLTRVPRYSGPEGDPDTVQVYGSRAASLCAPFASVWSQALITPRVDKPVITFVTSDTSVMQDSTLQLHVEATVTDGDPASYVWMEGEDKEVSRDDTYRFKVVSPAVYTVFVYQEAVLKINDRCYAEATVKVTMNTPGGEVYPLPPLADLELSASTQWLCGEGEVTYNLSEVAGYDTLVWFENGLEIARDVWQLQRTPAYTGFDRADTVTVLGIAVDPVTDIKDTVRYKTSNVVAVHRIEKPVFVYVSPRDTSVAAGTKVQLNALATAPDGPEIRYFWSDSLDEYSGDGATFLFYPRTTQHYYVIAEQRIKEMGAFECYAEDSVLVRVVPVKMGELEIYIPNTVIPYSHKVENTHLRVYGLNIKEVYLQVFNERSEKLYEGRGDAETTVWNATGTDGKIVPEGTYSYKATVIVEDSEGKEHTLNRQSWVQVIL